MRDLQIVLGVIMLLVVMVVPAWAQPGPPPATPIDGGISILLAAGGVYGLRKMRNIKKS